VPIVIEALVAKPPIVKLIGVMLELIQIGGITVVSVIVGNGLIVIGKVKLSAF
jgi:hypothetical protein